MTEHAGHAVAHGLHRAAAGQCDHGASAGLGLDRDDAEVFLAGQHDGRGATIQRRGLVVALMSKEFDLGAGGVRFETSRARVPAPTISEGQARQAGGVDRHVDSFVWHQCRHYRAATLPDWPSSGCEERSVHRTGTRRPTCRL